jgi:hypothetical protein
LVLELSLLFAVVREISHLVAVKGKSCHKAAQTKGYIFVEKSQERGMEYCAASVCAGFLKNQPGVIMSFHFEQTDEEDHCLCTEL